jgi:hypothetical protein
VVLLFHYQRATRLLLPSACDGLDVPGRATEARGRAGILVGPYYKTVAGAAAARQYRYVVQFASAAGNGPEGPTLAVGARM